MKYAPSKEDDEDAEQERQIKAWLNGTGQSTQSIDLRYLNGKGNARNVGVRASFSLDQKIQEDSAGTFADIIARCDGRDLYSGEIPSYLDPEPCDVITETLYWLGFNEGEEIEWLKKILLWSMTQKEVLSLISQTDSECETQFDSFST